MKALFRHGIIFLHATVFSIEFKVVQGNAIIEKQKTNSTLSFSGLTVLEMNELIIKPEESLEFSSTNQNDQMHILINSQNPALIQGNLFTNSSLTLECTGKLVVDKEAKIRGSERLSLLSLTSEISGSVEVENGEIEILAREINLTGAQISAANESNAGNIFIGRSEFRKQTASKVRIDSDTFLNASSLIEGNGGTILIWSDDQTDFLGRVESRGGALSGNGGFIEVSSKKELICQGSIDRRAPCGVPGLLLLDPEADITIQASGTQSGSFGMGPPFSYTPSSMSNIILIGPGPGTLLDYLEQGDVTIQTSYGGAAGPFGGRITLNDNMVYSSPHNLSLLANGENLVIQAQLENRGQGAILLEAPNGSVQISPSSGKEATVMAGGGVSISNVGGDVVLQGGSGVGEKVIIGDTAPLPPTGNFSMTGVTGNLIIRAGDSADTSASILSQAGTITVDVGGNITMSSGPVFPSEAYISGIPGNAINISCGGDLVMEKGGNDAADYMLIANETFDPITLNIGGMFRMIADIGFGGPVLATYGNITAMIGTDIDWESSLTAKVVIFGQTSAHFTIGGMAQLINPEIISNDFQILP
ncbi:MAG: hypothetical protein K1X28_02805 [Parachlamydiales bacterium]|nr:hypothetical protein [Parachlamydiales bacterium]